MKTLLTSLERSFDWHGRASRKEAWLFLAAAAVLIGLVALVEFWLRMQLPRPVSWAFLLAGLLQIPFSSLLVRRLHDAGHSGLWLATAVLPLLGYLVVAAILLAPQGGRYRSHDNLPYSHALGVAAILFMAAMTMSRAFYMDATLATRDLEPAILPGDHFLVHRGFGTAPDAGAVILFRSEAGKDMLGRVVGVAGDHLRLQDGQVILNGATLPQSADGTYDQTFARDPFSASFPACANAPVGLGGTCRNERAIETLPNGTSYAILNAGMLAQDNTQDFTVPPDHVFVLGDNRDAALDSRFAAPTGPGFVPVDRIIGKVTRVTWSSGGAWPFMVWDWRPGRTWLGVR